MLEQTRLSYLQAMGVTAWVPRQPLVYAPAPRWLAQTPESVAVDSDDGLDVEALFAEVESSSPNEPPAAPRVQPQPLAAAPVAASSPNVTPHFQLFFISSSLPVIWVCDNIADVESLQRFIYNVQRALRGQTEFAAQAFEFRWPYLRSQNHDQSTPVALQALNAHWQFMQSTNQAKAVISFGGVSQQWLQQLQVPELFYAASLAQCLQRPELKRQLWQQLLTLSD